MATLLPLLPATAQAMVASQGANLVAAAESHQVFTSAECAQIVALRDQLGWDSARVEARSNPTERQVTTTIRDTQRTHLVANAQTQWIYDRLAHTVERVNGETWQLRISHMEPIQLLRYPVGGHYDWHTDLGAQGVISLRKVSVTVLLNPPDQFEGGTLNGRKQLFSPCMEALRSCFPPGSAIGSHRSPAGFGTLWCCGWWANAHCDDPLLIGLDANQSPFSVSNGWVSVTSMPP